MSVALKPMTPRESYRVLAEAISAPARVKPTGKDIPLEAIRGLAAISVVLWHSMLAFFPEKSGFFAQFSDSQSFAGEPWFGLVYGTAAITLFFVLSGYVLTRRYFETHDLDIILRGILKRWPRLAGPVLIVVVASYALFALHGYSHMAAAEITKSTWLAHFANVSDKPFTPGISDALNQGLFATFFKGDAYYDSSLWTMRYEFGGSFIAFGAALALGLFRGVSKYAPAAALGVLLIFLNANGPAYSPFVIGVGLAYFLPRERNWPPILAYGAVVLAIYLFGFSGKSLGVYGFMPSALAGAVSSFHLLASLLLISAVEHGPKSLRRVLSSRLSAFLGALSFPIYLVHVLVICSAGSAAIVWANGAGWSLDAARGLGVAITLPLSALAALPLIAFNARWVQALNRLVAKMVASVAA